MNGWGPGDVARCALRVARYAFGVAFCLGFLRCLGLVCSERKNAQRATRHAERRMRIGINALFLQKPATGMGQHLLHLLEGLD